MSHDSCDMTATACCATRRHERPSESSWILHTLPVDATPHTLLLEAVTALPVAAALTLPHACSQAANQSLSAGRPEASGGSHMRVPSISSTPATARSSSPSRNWVP